MIMAALYFSLLVWGFVCTLVTLVKRRQEHTAVFVVFTSMILIQFSNIIMSTQFLYEVFDK